ncbi:MAG: bifunctional hydroxymethylpyrimidine kinase/phosphomethylpyrimidine kinase [Bacteroidales bacterium]|nr:bifunctional hydroxymethylpyrimidine kinase/phosphomethylpyrimidine kinase [Bacteroidales bacterium]
MNTKLIVISSPKKISSEIRKVVSLFLAGLKQYHIRKPGFNDFDMINYISSIPKEYHQYLVLHSHYHFAKEFKLKGIQVGKERIEEASIYKSDFKYFGYSAHSFDEIISYKDYYTHFFLSPVFNSISKDNYKSNFKISELSVFLSDNPELNIISLGGIDESTSIKCHKLGFSGIAILGAIWQAKDTLSAYKRISESINVRNFTLSIAGFDPSSGAGISSDIKTFEQHKVQGLGVITAITFQNESTFQGVNWLSFEQIKKQIESICHKYQPKFVKIGLIENFKVLREIINLLKELNAEVKIIWDPIFKASANFDFHTVINKKDLNLLLRDIYLITPNIPECESIFETSNADEIQSIISSQNICKVLVKGGHSLSDNVIDVLVEQSTTTSFNGKRIVNKDKHGTGCVLSAAICSNLANGNNLQASIKKAKTYVSRFIDSNNLLLGYHNITNNE